MPPRGLDNKNERLPSPQFIQRLQAVLDTPVKVDNIAHFANDALEELTTLIEDVTHRYKSEYEESDNYAGAALEDKACEVYGLENLNVILERIIEVKDSIDTIKIQVTEALDKTSTVITPPDQRGPVFSETGSGTYEAPNKVDRLLTLAYILSRDFEIDQSRVEYTEGSTTNAMLRQEPYVRVLIEDLNRIVYVCDEEGNASYVFDTEVLEHLGITPPELDVMTKNQRNVLIRVTPSAGRRIIQSPEWRSVMSTALREDFSDTKSIGPEATEPRSEFRERVKFLEYVDFVTTMRKAYEEAGAPKNVGKWYRLEYKKHRKWPTAPNMTYKDSGWKSWPELVGKNKDI